MSYRVSFAPEAVEQLAALYNHIADAASADIAKSIPQYLAFEVRVALAKGIHTVVHTF